MDPVNFLMSNRQQITWNGKRSRDLGREGDFQYQESSRLCLTIGLDLGHCLSDVSGCIHRSPISSSDKVDVSRNEARFRTGWQS
jgi:hypothetical protein